MKNWIIIIFLLPSLSLIAQKETVTYIPAEYDTIQTSIMVRPAYYKYVQEPAEFDTVTLNIQLREASKILKERWKYTYLFSRKSDADSIPGIWVSIKDTTCHSPNPEDCSLQMWVPESAEYDVREFKNYLGAEWDDRMIKAIVIQRKQIIRTRPARARQVYIPAEYQTIEHYKLRKPAKRIIRTTTQK
jgi:hypothetical protein